MNRWKTQTLERDVWSATRPGTASAVCVPGKSGTTQVSWSFSIKGPHVQMRIYGTHSQLLRPGEKMQFNALCQSTGYAWTVLAF